MIDPSLVNRVLDLAVAVQQIPAPTFSERERAEFVASRFQAEGLSEVEIDPVGNVYACLPGKERGKPFVLSAHLDTVFPASIDLQTVRQVHTISGAGIGDNSLGVAGLFGLIWALRQKESLGEPGLPGDLWFVANVGEEGLGNLCGMRAVVDRFGSNILAYLVLEGMALGQIYYRGLGVQRYRISVSTAGGHSWVDFGRPSAIHELARIITQITALPLPREPRTSYNVGVIGGGTSINTIASRASFELDLRSEGVKALAELTDQVERLVALANRPGVQIRAEMVGQRPAGEISSRHPLVRLAWRALENQGLTPHLNIGSTDANIPLSRGLPAICLGLTLGGGAHTLSEQIQVEPVAAGLAQVLEVVENAYREL